MKKNTFPPMPQDPYHRDDAKGEACRLAVAIGELSLHPDASNYIGNYTFFCVAKDGRPVYVLTADYDPNNYRGEREENKAYVQQMKATGRIY